MTRQREKVSGALLNLNGNYGLIVNKSVILCILITLLDIIYIYIYIFIYIYIYIFIIEKYKKIILIHNFNYSKFT